MVTEERKSERKSRSLNRSRAREMRHNPVSMEEAFWEEVRNRKLGGFKFKRQYLIGNYIADFVCLERRLVIELDGKLHDGREGYDVARDAFFREQGFDVYRLKNEEVAHNLPTVLATILHELTAPSPRPSPPLRGGEGDVRDEEEESAAEESGEAKAKDPPSLPRRWGRGPGQGAPMKRSILAALVMTFTTPALAIEHLEPERSSFDTRANLWDVDYNDMVLTKFKELFGHFGSGVIARMIGLPSFHHEYGVGISVNSDNWRIIALEATAQLWGYQNMSPEEIKAAHMPADWHDVPVQRCEQPIAPELGARLANLWERMLAGTRYQEGESVLWGADGKPQGGEIVIGSDGELFHFSASRMAGTTWSPPPDSSPGMLVDIAEAMIAYCHNNDARNLAAIEQKAAALEQRLNGSK